MRKTISSFIFGMLGAFVMIVALHIPPVAQALTDVVNWNNKKFQLTGTSSFYNAGVSTLVGAVTTSVGLTQTAGDHTLTAGDVIIGTTDRGMGSDTAAKTVKVCGGAAGAGCDAETIGAWATFEGIDFGGSVVGGGVNIEAAAGDATSDVTIATNLDAADILLRGGTTQATLVTVESDNGNVTLATGHLDIETSGKTIILEDGTASTSCIGTLTANGTTEVPVTTTCAQTGDLIFFSANAPDVNTANCWAHQISDGVDFDFDCDAATTTTFNWWIIKGQ